MHGCSHSIDGCLQVSAFRIGEGINVACGRIGITPNGLQTSAYRIGSGIFASCTRVDEDMTPSKGIIADAYRIGNGLKVTCGILCGVNKGSYLETSTDVLWLTSDMLGEEFDIYSNVNWKIDAKPSEDDKDIISMLLNELMIGNNTLFVNGDMPSQVLEMLHNGQMITNETLLADTSVIVIKELESSTRILNKYYLKN